MTLRYDEVIIIVVVYYLIVSYLFSVKPALMFDPTTKQALPVGIGEGQTLLPVWLVTVVILPSVGAAILSR
jgi:hypothetical protein